MSDSSSGSEGTENSGMSSHDRSFIVSGPVDIDCAKVMDHIQARMRDQPPAPSPGGTSIIEGPSGDSDETDSLERAKRLLSVPGVAHQIGWQTPILGHIWARVRGTFFGEARAYMDANFARQSEVDLALIETIEELRQEISELRVTIERISRDGS